MILFLYHPFSSMDILLWKQRLMQEFRFTEVYFADSPNTLFSLIGAYGQTQFFTIALTCWSKACADMLETVSQFFPDATYWILPQLSQKAPASQPRPLSSPLYLLSRTLPPALREQLRRQDAEAYVSFCKQKEDVFLKRNILYVESDRRRITVHTAQQQSSYYERLDTAERQLGSSFLRCHQSFLVNLRHIWEMRPEYFLLYNGSVIPISRSRRSQANEVWGRYRLTKTDTHPQN